MAEFNLEKDPVTGKELNRLADYNDSKPVAPVVKPMTEFFGKQVAFEGIRGGFGDTNLVDYTESKYDSSIFVNELSNLDQLRHNNQSSLDMLGRATANFIGKTAVNVVGGVAGTVYGGAQAIAEGRVSALWDNELTTVLDKASDGIREYFKVYNSNDFENRNLIQRMFLNPVQFTDELLDTLSFTAGAVVTEMLTAGVGSAAILPRAMRYFKALSKAEAAGTAAAKVGSSGTKILEGLGKAGTLSRQLATGAAYEAAVESRQATLELRNKMHSDWLEDNPGLSLEEMPEEIREDIDNRLSDAGLFTFLTNIALVGASNIIQFPKVFSGNTDNMYRNISNRISREGDQFVDNLSTLSTGQRRLRNTAIALKNPFMEGIVEEGGQRVLSGTAQSFWDRSNDESARNTVDQFLGAFGKNLIDTYTTAEGWEEIGMGMIIGSMGAPGRGIMSIAGRDSAIGKIGFNEDGSRRELWTGGILGSFQVDNAKTREIEGIIEELNNNTSLMDSMKSNYDFLIKSKSLDDAQERALEAGDMFNYRNYQDDRVHAYIMSRLNAGLISDLNSQVDDLQRMDPDTLYTEFRGDTASESTSDDAKLKFKMDHLDALKKRIKATSDAHNKVSSSPFLQGRPEVQEYLTHALASASYLDIREDQMSNRLQELSGNTLGGPASRSSSTRTIASEIKALESMIKNESVDKDTKDAAKRHLSNLKKLDKSTLNLITEDLSALRTLSEVAPATAAANMDEIVSLLEDTTKLREKRHQVLDTFNTYFTKEGVDALESRIEKEKEARERARLEREEREAEERKIEEAKKEAESRKEAIRTKKKPESQSVQDTVEEEIPSQEQPYEPPAQPVELSKLEKLENDLNSLEDSRADELNNIDNKTIQGSIGTQEFADNVKARRQEIHDKYDALEEELKEEIRQEQIAQGIVDEIFEDSLEDDVVREDNPIKEDIIELDNPTSQDIEKMNKASVDLQSTKRNVGAALAYSSIDKELVPSKKEGKMVFEDLYDDEGNLLFNKYFDQGLLSNKQYKIGDSLTMRIPTYQEMLDRGIEDYSEDQYNKDMLNEDSFPIGVYNSSGELIGFYPTRDNILRNVQEGALFDTYLKENEKERNFIFNNRGKVFNIKISSKSPGVVMFNRNDNEKPLLRALGDGKKLNNGVILAIGKTMSSDQEGATLFTNASINGAFDKKLTIPNKYLLPGFLYSIVPTASEGMFAPTPLSINPVGENLANVIVEAIRLYGNRSRTAEDKATVEGILEHNITSAKGIRDFIDSIIYSTSSRGNDSNTLRLSDGKLILSPTDSTKVFNISDIVDSADTRAEVANILKDRYPSFNLNHINSNKSYVSYSLKDNKLVEEEYSNFQDYATVNNLVSTSQTFLERENGEKVYTVQPVIELSKSSAAGEYVPPVKEELDREVKDVKDLSQEHTNPAIADIERRRQEDFQNENESYRVIVGDEAFNDIVESGVVRTNANNKGGQTLAEKIAKRPTLYPSFSKGRASMEYANANPNNYIIVTEDSSIQPSTSGRHGKGTTMFPTDENGKHLTELSGKKIKVYKHTGNGEYILVYANGKQINAKYDAELKDTKLAQETDDLFSSHEAARLKLEQEETSSAPQETFDSSINNPYSDVYVIGNEVLDKESRGLVADFDSNSEALEYFKKYYVTKKPTRSLGLNINKLKGKDIDFNISPDFISKTTVTSFEEFNKRCK